MSVRRSCLLKTVVLASLILNCGAAEAQSVDNLLVVVNSASPASREIADYYAAKRGVAADHLVTITVDPADEVSRADYDAQIERPISQWLTKEGAQDRTLYIVLTKGVPLRVQGTAGGKGTIASVDSELTLLYRKLTGIPIDPSGPLPNPYFLGSTPLGNARAFSHEQLDIYLVTRLDGFTVDDVKGLIDRGVNPEHKGTIVLDQRVGPIDLGDKWLNDTADSVRSSGLDGIRVDVGVAAPASATNDALGYYSWGSNDPATHARQPSLGYAPGALAAMFASADARTFIEPDEKWTLGRWGDERTYYAGSPASLTGDLIRQGVTGVAGSVADPFLEGAVRPTILFPAYLGGRNLAEAFYLATPFLSWQTVVVGDPLCAPFPGARLLPEQVQPARDAVTELPSWFSARRLQLMAHTGIKTEALKLYMRAESRMRHEDNAAARTALEEATAIDDRLVPGNQLLATMYERSEEYDKAIDRYRRVLAFQPTDAAALNNLAFALAVRKGQVDEALPLAQQAYSLAANNPAIADTLGWIQHLRGDNNTASGLLTRAAAGLPDNADVQVRAAIALAATRDVSRATELLGRAVALDPALEQRDEVRQLRSQLQATSTP